MCARRVALLTLQENKKGAILPYQTACNLREHSDQVKSTPLWTAYYRLHSHSVPPGRRDSLSCRTSSHRCLCAWLVRWFRSIQVETRGPRTLTRWYIPETGLPGPRLAFLCRLLKQPCVDRGERHLHIVVKGRNYSVMHAPHLWSRWNAKTACMTCWIGRFCRFSSPAAAVYRLAVGLKDICIVGFWSSLLPAVNKLHFTACIFTEAPPCEGLEGTGKKREAQHWRTLVKSTPGCLSWGRRPQCHFDERDSLPCKRKRIRARKETWRLSISSKESEKMENENLNKNYQ